MSTDNVTKRMISAYNQTAQPTLFLSGFFQSPAMNFYNSEEIEFDIIRDEEDISIVVTDLSSGTRMNASDLYTNKSFKAPPLDESIAINSFDLLKRVPGSDPFQNVDFRSNISMQMMRGMNAIERKIRRTLELQASQILQTGKLLLKDKNGNDLYELDFKPKTSHFPDAAAPWSSGGADIAADISGLAEEIRNNGLSNADQLIMGVDAFENFIADADIQKRYNNRRIDLGTISPMEMRGKGGSFRGIVEIGNYRYDIWTYGGRYKDPQTGNKLQYLDNDKVIVRSSMARMDATFGSVPNIGGLLGVNKNISFPEIPARFSNVNGGMDLNTYMYVSEDGKQLVGNVSSRPLLIPTAIDTYGCINTNP